MAMCSRGSDVRSTCSRAGAELGRVYCTALSPRRWWSTVRLIGSTAALSSARDEPAAAAVRDPVVRPAHDDHDAVLEADEVDEVHHEPEDPGGEAADAQPVQVGD